MRAAMADAEVGDDVYGEDPTVNAAGGARSPSCSGTRPACSARPARWRTCSASGCWCTPGQELLCDCWPTWSGPSSAATPCSASVSTRTWATPGGRLDAAPALAMAVPDGGPYLVSTAAVAVENTHNFGGGTVQPVDELRTLREGSRRSRHRRAPRRRAALERARRHRRPAGRRTAPAPTPSRSACRRASAPRSDRCWSASAERIAAARVWRKRYGGGMRQVGVLAAAGRYALEHHVRPAGRRPRRAPGGWPRLLAAADERLCDPAEVADQHRRAGRRRPSRRRPRPFAAGRGRAGVPVGRWARDRCGWSRTWTWTTPPWSAPGRAAGSRPSLSRQS